MDPFTRLYPNVITKENLLTPSVLAPFRNFSSQLAALDFIACATADAFAMTDSGSQLSSSVSGFRTYYRVKKMIKEGQKAGIRSYGRSIYRHPRCPECMCKHQ